MSRKSARIISLGLLVAGLVLVLMAIAGNGASSGGALDVTVRTKDFIITGVYKVYGLENQPVGIWVAKTVFGNQTGGTIRNLRVRYRVDQYTSDWSAWKIYPVVVPGQTVVDCYYPLLSRDCAALTSRTPTDLRIEYEYTDTAGILHTDAASKRLTLLGRHEFVHGGLPWEEVQPTFQDAFSNSPLMAAWVTSNDPPVRRLAGFANEWAGGAGGSITDEGCWKVLKEFYNAMLAIDVSYQSSTGTAMDPTSFDPKLIQTLKYPRETIRDRSGTCVELAILYAAMCKSQGIKPYLVSMPGHCFPIARMPNGQMVPVEATCVGGGSKQCQPFEKAVEIGIKTWQELQQTGQFILIDIDECINAGITSPELEPLGDDVFDRWGLTTRLAAWERRGGGAGTDGTGTGTGTGGGGGGGTPPPPPPQGMKPGTWSVIVTSPAGQAAAVAQVATQGEQVVIIFQLQYQVTDQQGMVHQCQEVNKFVGTQRGNQVNATCNEAQWIMDGQQVQPTLPMTLRLTLNGPTAAQGVCSVPGGQSVQVTMQSN